MNPGITFTTDQNKSKYYFNIRKDGSVPVVDYPSLFIGTKTPTMFIWSKMEHLYTIIGAENINDKIVVDGAGKELSALDFITIASDSRLWTFERKMEMG